MRAFVQDLRFALRQMRRAPGFFILAALTLGLGIGTATAVFSVLDATFLRPLPYANQARLVSLAMNARSGYSQPASYPSYVDMRRQLRAFSGLSAIDYKSANVQTATGASPVHVIEGSDDLFQILGNKPLLGRGFLPGEEQTGRNNVAVLSYGVWQRDFGGRSDVIGSLARLNGESYTVVGVMPQAFRFPLTETATIFTPLHVDPRMLTERGMHEFSLLALLKPGIDLPHAQADANRVMADLARAFPASDDGRTAAIRPLAQALNGNVAPPLTLLTGAVSALLLIACVNVAGLLLARAVRREHEMAVRAAIGASRRRLLWQAVTETLAIAAAGALVGVGLAFALLAAMRAFLLQAMARGQDTHVNGAALLAAMLLAGLSALAAGLLPALRLSRVNPSAALRTGTAAAGTQRGQQHLRSGLLITQIALSLLLLAVSALLMQHLRSMVTMDLGYSPDRILAVRVSLGAGDYRNRDPLVTFYRPLLERVVQQPGAVHAGLVNLLPIAMFGSNAEIKIAGQPIAPKSEQRLAEIRLISQDYLATMGGRLLAGRALTPSLDRPDNSTFVVNQAFAREFLPGTKSPVGSMLQDTSADKPIIVGEYSDMRQAIDQPQMPEMDFLIDSEPVEQRRTDLLHMFLVMRAADGVDPMSFVPQIRQMVHGLDAGAALDQAMTMRDELNEALVFQRLLRDLFGGFAACALLLTLVGVYGTVRHEAELRTRDIGVRMALGASRGRVLAGLLRRAAVLAGAGLGIGLLLTGGAQRTLASLLELHPRHEADLLTAIAIGLFVVTLLAAAVPARRAASLDPVKALRTE